MNERARRHHGAPVVTSADAPIRIDWIVGEPQLSFGITLCPGKKASGTGVFWNRDLSQDLVMLERLTVDVLVVLIPECELRLVGVPDLLDRARAYFHVEHHPFDDGAIPDDLLKFAAFVDRLVALVEDGEHVVAQCRGGLGRAGLVAACVLLRMDRFQNAEDAIAEVRRRRSPRAVETREQEQFVARYAAHLRRRR